LAPHSPGTHEIDTLLWIGFIAAAIVIVAVNVGLFYALRRYRDERGSEPRQLSGGRRIQFRVGGLLAVFAVAILVLGILFTDRAREVPTSSADGLQTADKGPLRIEATGQQWLWRYEYPNEAFSYYQLVVPVDTAVELDLVSTDVVHTWDVPELAGKRDAVPGKHNRVVFEAEEEGTFDGRSATLSGQAYAPMRTEVKVVSPEEYEAFVKRQKSDIQEAQDRVVELFNKKEVP
jgi:cytochrome c oxidase subunit 2